MNTPKSSDDVQREMNDLAKAQGRYLDKAFWEVPRQSGSIVDVPLTPEAEERIRRLDERIARLKQQRAAGRGPKRQQADCSETGSPKPQVTLDTISQFKKREEEAAILRNLAAKAEPLDQLLQECSSHWGYEDPIYRFYHQSFKVFGLQTATEAIVKHLQELAPHLPLNPRFLEIVQQGTGREFTPADNAHWLPATRPILEAFFHARYFLEMACKYGRELKEPPDTLPSGWAAVLYLFNLR